VRRTCTVRITRSAEEVFGFLAEVANETRWRRSIAESGFSTDGAPGVGTSGYTVAEMGGKSVTMPWQVVRFDPGRHMAWELTGGPWRGGGSYTVAGQGEATDVTADLQVRLPGAARLLEPLLGFRLGHGLRTDLERLRGLLQLEEFDAGR
jgi:hypothetical protein